MIDAGRRGLIGLAARRPRDRGSTRCAAAGRPGGAAGGAGRGEARPGADRARREAARCGAHVAAMIEADIAFHNLDLRGLRQSAHRGERRAALAPHPPRDGRDAAVCRARATGVGRARGDPRRDQRRRCGARRAPARASMARAPAAGLATRVADGDARTSRPRSSTEEERHEAHPGAAPAVRPRRLSLLPEPVLRGGDQGADRRGAGALRAAPARERAREDRRRGAHELRRAHVQLPASPASPATRAWSSRSSSCSARTCTCTSSRSTARSAFDGDVWQWHQDYGTWQADDQMPEARAMNVAIFLDEVNEFNGPLMFIPGSHKLGRGRGRSTTRPRPAIRCGPSTTTRSASWSSAAASSPRRGRPDR